MHHHHRASFGGVEFYSEFERKAAVLLEHLVKNLPLPDGDKRTVYATIDAYLGPISSSNTFTLYWSN